MSWTYQHYVTSQLVLGWRSIFCWWPCHVGQQCQSVDVLPMGMLARSLVGSLSADYASIPRHVGIAGGPLSGLAAPGCLAPRPVLPPETGPVGQTLGAQPSAGRAVGTGRRRCRY